jgi:hypothetical protein
MFAEDLTIFFKDFGIEIVFSRSSVEIATSTLILDSPSSDQAIYDRSFYDEKFYEARVQQSTVRLLGIQAEVAAVEINDTATVNGQDWYVIETEPDGTGLITIHLSENQI